MTRCTYLTEEDRCAIYLNRPKVCRSYTTEACEYDAEWTFDKVFETPEQIWEYAEAILLPRRTRRQKSAFALPIVNIN
jgi:Fe-S-cluster containining protein